jgi:hypothetical protein
MDVINCRNVNDGFIKAMDMLSFDQQDIRESRGRSSSRTRHTSSYGIQ